MCRTPKPNATILATHDDAAGRSLAAGSMEEHPGWVVLDVHMADMDDFMVCQRIRAFPRGCETPVVARVRAALRLERMDVVRRERATALPT
jgi:CheY-like chemotaxis protein